MDSIKRIWFSFKRWLGLSVLCGPGTYIRKGRLPRRCTWVYFINYTLDLLKGGLFWTNIKERHDLMATNWGKLVWPVYSNSPLYSFIPSPSETRMLLTSEWRKGASYMRVRVSSEEGHKHPSRVLRLIQRREGWKSGGLPALLSSSMPRCSRDFGVLCFETHQNPIVLVPGVLILSQTDLSLILGKVILKH